jgi:hypothetical protein
MYRSMHRFTLPGLLDGAGKIFNGLPPHHLKAAGISGLPIIAFSTYKLELKKKMKSIFPVALLMSGWSMIISPTFVNAKSVPVPAFLTGDTKSGSNISFTYDFKFEAHDGDSLNGAGLFSLSHAKLFGKPSPNEQINTLNLPKSFEIDDLPSGHGSKGIFNLDYQVGSLNGNNRPWSILATAFARPDCKKNKRSCGAITATAKIKAAQSVEKEAKAVFKIGNETKIPKAKDPTYSLSLNDFPDFFSASLFRDPATDLVNATYHFGIVPDPFVVDLDYNGISCELSTCSTNPAFLSELSYIHGIDNWSLDPNGDFIANKDIALPGVTVNQSATLRAGFEQQAPGLEAVPGPLPVLGIAAAFGYTRKLRQRIKPSKPEVISTTAV